MRLTRRAAIAGALLLAPALVLPAQAEDAVTEDKLARKVREAVEPVMAEHDIPGMAVAVTIDGTHHVFNFGVASPETGRKVDDATLFEVGSVSKTYTATLGAWAAGRGALSLEDPASKHMASLAGTAFDDVSLLDLATYTAGGLPLQFPNGVTDEKTAIAFYARFKPKFPPGTTRQYSNPSIGLFGFLAAKSLGKPFDAAMEQDVLPALGLSDTFIRVPEARRGDYAMGTTKAGKPARMSPGAFGSEAYGIKTTATDLIRYVEANIAAANGDKSDDFGAALKATHTAYYTAGVMTQGLGWEMYDDPVKLDTLLAGNSTEMALEPQKVARIEPPRAPKPDVLLNKTGSTNGFGAYVAFVPERRIGIAILANRNYPNPARITAALRILNDLR